MSETQATFLSLNKTFIPLGMLTVVIGGAVWLTTVWWTVSALKEKVSLLESGVIIVTQNQRSTDDRVLRVEAKIDQILEKVTISMIYIDPIKNMKFLNQLIPS